MVFHVVDIAVVNLYVLFEDVRQQNTTVSELQRPKGYGQLEFRQEIVRQLVGVEEREEVPMGRYNKPPVRKSQDRCGGQPIRSDNRRNCVLCCSKSKVIFRSYIQCDTCDKCFLFEQRKKLFQRSLMYAEKVTLFSCKKLHESSKTTESHQVTNMNIMIKRQDIN